MSSLAACRPSLPATKRDARVDEQSGAVSSRSSKECSISERPGRNASPDGLKRCTYAGISRKPSDGLDRRPPPYHVIQTAAGGSLWQRFGGTSSRSRAFAAPNLCRPLRPLCTRASECAKTVACSRSDLRELLIGANGGRCVSERPPCATDRKPFGGSVMVRDEEIAPARYRAALLTHGLRPG